MNDATPLEPPRSALALYLDLIRFNRPAGWLLLLWPTLSALWLASGGFPGWHLLVVFVLGTFLMRSAGCCVNDVADRDFDKHVKRTAQRPVTSGALSVKQALTAGAVLAMCAFGLVLTTNTVTVAWSVVSTKANALKANNAPALSACFTDKAPEVTGRWAVRLTCLSNSRSATSLTQQPALRIRKVPNTNTPSKCQPGKPPLANHKALRVGHSSSSQPAGRLKRIKSR